MPDLPPITELFWQLCDPDAKPGTTFRTGYGVDELAQAILELTAVEEEHTPAGFISSGNIAVYWSRKLRERV